MCHSSSVLVCVFLWLSLKCWQRTELFSKILFDDFKWKKMNLNPLRSRLMSLLFGIVRIHAWLLNASKLAGTLLFVCAHKPVWAWTRHSASRFGPAWFCDITDPGSEQHYPETLHQNGGRRRDVSCEVEDLVRNRWFGFGLSWSVKPLEAVAFSFTCRAAIKVRAAKQVRDCGKSIG